MIRRPIHPSIRRGIRRSVTALGVGALLIVGATLGLLGLASPAAAHDAVRGTLPADGATVDAAPSSVKITFTAAVLEGTAQLRVTGPAGVVPTGTVAVAGSTVAAALDGAVPNGGYTVDWRVTSADGHPVSGTFRFTVAVPGGASAPAPAPSASLDTTPVPAASTAAPSEWPVVVAVALTLVAGGLFWWSRRGGAEDNDGHGGPEGDDGHGGQDADHGRDADEPVSDPAER